MAVAYTAAMDSEFWVIGFARNGTTHPNAFVVTHTAGPNATSWFR